MKHKILSRHERHRIEAARLQDDRKALAHSCSRMCHFGKRTFWMMLAVSVGFLVSTYLGQPWVYEKLIELATVNMGAAAADAAFEI